MPEIKKEPGEDDPTEGLQQDTGTAENHHERLERVLRGHSAFQHATKQQQLEVLQDIAYKTTESRLRLAGAEARLPRVLARQDYFASLPAADQLRYLRRLYDRPEHAGQGRHCGLSAVDVGNYHSYTLPLVEEFVADAWGGGVGGGAMETWFAEHGGAAERRAEEGEGEEGEEEEEGDRRTTLADDMEDLQLLNASLHLRGADHDIEPKQEEDEDEDEEEDIKIPQSPNPQQHQLVPTANIQQDQQEREVKIEDDDPITTTTTTTITEDDAFGPAFPIAPAPAISTRAELTTKLRGLDARDGDNNSVEAPGPLLLSALTFVPDDELAVEYEVGGIEGNMLRWMLQLVPEEELESMRFRVRKVSE